MPNAARTPLLMLACVLLAACDTATPASGDATPAPAGASASQGPDHQAAVQVSEQRIDALMEVARALRDADANLAWPVADAFWAEARTRHPATDPRSDITLDGWQRPLIYVREGDMRRMRLYSAGPNGKDEYGLVDDVALRQGETTIE
ncbi:hypothetical protein [Lysobacter sp. A3-1-A15]|uniref:hypothetical protein n=1 Tax=Novilysobacter viscosus TaxID=3098602 RepID=UPI002ED92BA9